jgi:hypothetical protein
VPLGLVVNVSVTGSQYGPGKVETYPGDRTATVSRGRRSPKVAHLRVQWMPYLDVEVDPQRGPRQVRALLDSEHPETVLRLWIERMEQEPSGQ